MRNTGQRTCLHAGTAQERMCEHIIRGTVEGVLQAALHPRTAISVSLQVLSEDGGLLACALNAACAALVDAAVPLNRTFGAAGYCHRACMHGVGK